MDRMSKGFLKKMRIASLIMLILPLFAIHGIAVGSSQVAAGSIDQAAEANSQIQHVLLISVDGLHQSDLEWYVE